MKITKPDDRRMMNRIISAFEDKENIELRLAEIVQSCQNRKERAKFSVLLDKFVAVVRTVRRSSLAVDTIPMSTITSVEGI